MITDFTGQEPAINPTNTQGSLFAATPIWERNRKRSGFGAGRKRPAAAVARSSVDPAAASVPSPPRKTALFGGGAMPIVIAAGLGVVTAAAVVGWIVTRPADGIPMIDTDPIYSQVDGAPITPTAPAEMAANTLPSPMPTTAPAPTMATAPAPARRAEPAPRVRPAPPPSAGDMGVNAAAALPDGPQPYVNLTPSEPSTITPAAPPVMADEAPASIPQTPPVLPVPGSATAPADSPALDLATPPT